MRLHARVAVAAACLGSASALAGPNLGAEDPAWLALRDQIALGRIADPLGGVTWLGEERAAALLAGVSESGAAAAAVPAGLWARPVQRLALRAAAADEHDRPYSLPAHPRDLAGVFALSCEHQEGRPCGDGAGLALELDSAAGYGDWLTAATRVRARVGSGDFGQALDLDRAYLKFEVGPLAVQLGRDALALGPGVRSATMVSDHAVPQDGVRLQLHPVALPFAPWLRVSLFYFLDRLRAPQTFSGTLLDCMRMQVDLADRLQLGGSRLLQLGGDGAPGFGGLWGFVGEHFGRSTNASPEGAENNRLSLDASLRLPELRGARLYYEIAFEDTRNPLSNSILYDADHLLGLEVRAVDLGPLRRLFVEALKTSWISQEHGLFRTGMTNGGRTLGTPYGPDVDSLWLRADLAFGGALVSPWTEWLRCFSDRYDVTDAAGVFLVARGVTEHRQRLGVDLTAKLAPGWTLSGGLFGERVGNADLIAGATRLNAGMRASLAWEP